MLDIIDESRINHSETSMVLKYCVFNNYTIVISEDILSTIFYIYKDKQKVLDFFNIIKDDWVISPFGKEVINSAIGLSIQKKLDLEDLLQCLCAKINDCDILITNDKKFYDCDMNIATSREFLSDIRYDMP